MSEAPYVPFYTSDFLGGTSGMTAATKGVYITLLCLMYEAERPLTQRWDALSRRCGCTLPAFRKAIADLQDDGKIEVTDGEIWSSKCEKHIAQRRERSDSAASAAKKRWGKTEEKQSKTNANALRTQCQPEPYTVSKDTDADGVVDLTQVLWSRGVSFLVRHGVKEKSARTMIGKWLKGHSVSEVFQAFGAASKNGTRDPVPYITKALRGNGEQKLDAWGIADAKPVRFEQSPEHQDAEGDAGEADLPSMLAPSQEVEPENPMSVGDAELGGDCGFLSSLRLVGGRSV